MRTVTLQEPTPAGTGHSAVALGRDILPHRGTSLQADRLCCPSRAAQGEAEWML